MFRSLCPSPPVTTEYGRHQEVEVSGYLHREGDPDDYSQSFVQHQGPVRGKSGKNQGGCWENAGAWILCFELHVIFQPVLLCPCGLRTDLLEIKNEQR